MSTMGCNCGSKRAGVKYEVRKADGSVVGKYDTVTEAQRAGEASGQGYTFRAVAS